eukprot:g14604.t1
MEDGTGASAGLWMPLQLKTGGKRAPAWSRKMRYNLKKQRTSLRGALYVGHCSEEKESVLVEQVHRCKDYAKYDPTAATSNVSIDNLRDALDSFCSNGLGARLEEGEPGADSMMAYSKETLEEKKARAFPFFVRALRTIGAGQLTYSSALLDQEYSCVDGLLSLSNEFPDAAALLDGLEQHSASESGQTSSCSSASSQSSSTASSDTARRSEKSLRIQEKALTIRRDQGKEYGLRCPMRRASGKPYTAADADYLLLHVRARTDDAAKNALMPDSPHSSRLHGSALIPWRVLKALGIVSDEDAGQPGKACASFFPAGAPGVPDSRARPGGRLEQFYAAYGEHFCEKLRSIIINEESRRNYNSEDEELASASGLEDIAL